MFKINLETRVYTISKSENNVVPKPKYVASFNDTTMELTITNPLEINQSGRFFIVDEIRPLTGETNFKHISFSIDGKKTNQSDFSIPPYARQTFTVNLNAPRNIEGNIATLRLGL